MAVPILVVVSGSSGSGKTTLARSNKGWFWPTPPTSPGRVIRCTVDASAAYERIAR